jgi:isocitrate dehydrogenase
MASYACTKDELKLPPDGELVKWENGKLIVPDNPIIVFIEGDGIGPEIVSSARKVLDAAVEKA